MRKKKKSDASGLDPMGWMTTFTDLVTLLMTFFVLLNSIAIIDEERQRLALNSFIGSLGILGGGLSAIESAPRSMLPPSAPIEKAIEEPELIEQLLRSKIASGLSVAGKGLPRIISIKDAVLFEPGDYHLKPEARSFLLELAHYLNLNDYPIRIEGHTDDMIRASPGIMSDWQLSGLRALAVLRFMVKEGKVAARRLSAFGYGSHRPIAPNNTALNRAKNRRVNIILDERDKQVGEHMEDKLRRPLLYEFKGFLFRMFNP
ncbi:MAG: flagellar motor protein MotB [Deltaproteobacteria bacterium]|nr:flagellar motor protein MotB [Deltaproteobacteria bacterium]MBW2069724.1 flagellar motor protein MotB [Deltaproteobacteria bacterium]